MTRFNVRYLFEVVWGAVLFAILFAPAPARAMTQAVRPANSTWNKALLRSIGSFPDKGGYYTGLKPNRVFSKTAWKGMSDAFKMDAKDTRPQIYPTEAVPSFCSSGVYMAVLKTISDLQSKGTLRLSRDAWIGLKPYSGIKDALNSDAYRQDDGFGCWGRANANGPGWAVLANELGVGSSLTAFRGAFDPKNRVSSDESYYSDDAWSNLKLWDLIEPGDLLKIFWNYNSGDDPVDSGAMIGVDDDPNTPDEAGHMVVFLGWESDGSLSYWSSNGPTGDPASAGYGVGHATRAAIQRIVVTHIDNPKNFENARVIARDDEQKWLSDLNGSKHGTTEELERYAASLQWGGTVYFDTELLALSASFDGSIWPKEGFVFRFNPKSGIDWGEKQISQDDMPLPEKIEVKLPPGSSYAPQRISFGRAAFNAPGYYKYSVSQVAAKDASIYADQHVVDIIVAISSDGYGGLKAAFAISGNTLFENKQLSAAMPEKREDEKTVDNHGRRLPSAGDLNAMAGIGGPCCVLMASVAFAASRKLIC